MLHSTAAGHANKLTGQGTRPVHVSDPTRYQTAPNIWLLPERDVPLVVTNLMLCAWCMNISYCSRPTGHKTRPTVGVSCNSINLKHPHQKLKPKTRLCSNKSAMLVARHHRECEAMYSVQECVLL